MTSLKLDFNQRISCDLNSNIFSNFNNQDYRLKDITFYYFYVISKIKKNSNTVVLCCNPSIESHILSFFLILSKFDVYLINNYSNEITKSLEDHTIITFEKKPPDKIKFFPLRLYFLLK